MTDFLGLEPLLVERLESRLEARVKAVLRARDLAGVAEQRQVTPAVYVIYQGHRPTEQRGDGAVQRVAQQWMVVTAVRNVRAVREGQGVREEAGPIVAAVLGALLGWRPSDDYSPLHLVAGPAAGWTAGYGYVPLVFGTQIVFRGDDT